MVSEITPVVLAEGHKHTMALDQSALLEVLGGDLARRDAGRLGRLGRVLGQVRRDRDIGDLPAAGEADDAGIDLVAPGDVPAVRFIGCGTVANQALSATWRMSTRPGSRRPVRPHCGRHGAQSRSAGARY
jgi:hypothetical protein